jgi:hypothetical protein
MYEWTTSDMEQIIRMRSAGATFKEIAKAMGRTKCTVTYRYNLFRCDTRKVVDAKCYRARAIIEERKRKRRARERNKLRKGPLSYDEWGRGPLALCGRVKAEKLITRIFAGELTERQAQEMAR